jgi:predicted nucleotidyltransferase component of viral defense system
LKPLRQRLEDARKATGAPWEILERDYLLSFILAGIAGIRKINATLVFKGGTALKKCYFGDYRFSEDLDYSALPKAPRGKDLEKLMRRACDKASALMNEYSPVRIVFKRYAEKKPHPAGQEAFEIRAQFPWHKEPLARVLVKVTFKERLLKPAVKKSLIHEYGEKLGSKITVYSLEEIIAEKLRAILQNKQILEKKGWSRSRARDFYDLWRIFKTYSRSLKLAGFKHFLEQKCRVRGVFFKSGADFFPDVVMGEVERTWDQWLGPLVPELPPYQKVIGELKPSVAKILEK